jgi:hypothetical protein
MLATIDLNDQPFVVTGKVDKIRADRRLPAKMRSHHRHASQMPPQFSLGIC